MITQWENCSHTAVGAEPKGRYLEGHWASLDHTQNERLWLALWFASLILGF